jgi:hypothetical protein
MEGLKQPPIRDGRSFSLEFKKQVVGELLRGERRPAHLPPRYKSIERFVMYYLQAAPSIGWITIEPDGFW